MPNNEQSNFCVLPKQNYFGLFLPKQNSTFIDYQCFTHFCLSKINLPKQKYRTL